MDHRRVIAALPAERRAGLTRKSDLPGLAHLALHLSALSATGVPIALGVPLWPLLLPLHGVLLIFLFSAMHEASHRTAFERRWLNDRVAQACGFLLFLPPEWFRQFHFAHHRHTQDPERDPELASPKPGTWPEYLLHVSGLPVWRGQLRALACNALGRRDDAFVPEGARGRVRREARLMLAGYAALAVLSLGSGSALLIWLWIVPALLGQPALRLYLLAEHGRCPLVADMFANSRTTLTTRLVRFLAWNMPYHAEHHALPAVPFHRLPEFHALVRAHLCVTERGYARFHRDYVSGLG